MEAMPKRKSIFGVGGLIGSLSLGDNAFKLAMYNGLAILLVLVALVITYGVYCILHPFLKPLIWALLCGSVLHPFKQMLSEKVRIGITKLGSDSKPFSVNIICFPIFLTLSASERMGNCLMEHRMMLIKFIGSICCFFVIYFYTPQFILNLNIALVYFVKVLLIKLLDIFNSTLLLIAVLTLYLSCLSFFWHPELKNRFFVFNLVVWIITSAWISNCFEYFKLALFVLFQGLPCCCCLYSMLKDYIFLDQGVVKESPETNEIISSDSISSLQVIKWISYACGCILIANIPSFLYIILVLLAIFSVKHLCITFGISDIFKDWYETIGKTMEIWFSQRKCILFPPAIEDIVSVITMLENKLLNFIKGSCDSAATVAVILFLLIFALFSSIFLTMQAYKEGVFLIQVGGDIINKTIISNPEVHQLLPEDWKSTTETALNDAYIYAREYIAKMVRSALKNRGIDKEQSSEIENSALELWDRAYQAWVMPIQPKIGPAVTPDAVFSSCYNFIERLKKSPEVMSVGWIKDLIFGNMAALNGTFNSIWAIIKGNASSVFSIIATLFSILFGGGISLINFTLNSVVFLTALFYLLSSSRQMYKPVEIITQLSPKYGKRLALAVENSCREVLAASAKLSAFYGLWTWLIHKVFQSNMAYMPAVFAGILGVVPLFGTHWVCIPAFFDLWYVQDSKIRAVGLFIAQLFPTAIVETAVYKEIKGGHPYLTGLSVAGGMFWLGIEGVIVGPLLLCFVFVALNIISTENNTYETY